MAVVSRREIGRLEAVDRYGLVSPDRTLRDLLHLAADVSHAPIAVLSLLEKDTVRLVAAWGLPTDLYKARRGSFCELVVAAGRAVTIPDAEVDLRVSENPLVAGGTAVRYYTGVPLHSGGHVVGALGIFDVHPRTRDDELLRTLTVLAARIDTEAALRLAVTDGAANGAESYRQELISLISHEIRTPITNIQGCVEILLDEPGTIAPQHVRFAESISRNTARLCRTVDHLLHAASAGAGGLRHARHRLDLVAVVAARLDQLGRHVGLVAPAHPVEVAGDARSLGRAIDNLIVNAIAYSASDTPVTVTVTAYPLPTVRVTDRGVGIPPDELPYVGTPFFRGAYARTHEMPGLGLGLAMTHQTVVAHSGTLTLHTGPEGGTTAEITLPAVESEAPLPQPAVPQPAVRPPAVRPPVNTAGPTQLEAPPPNGP